MCLNMWQLCVMSHGELCSMISPVLCLHLHVSTFHRWTNIYFMVKVRETCQKMPPEWLTEDGCIQLYISIISPTLLVYVYLQKFPIHWSNPYVMILKSCFWLWHLYVQLVYSTFLVALSPLSSCSPKKTALAASSVLDPPLALHHSIVKYEVAATRRVSSGHRRWGA